MKFETQSRLGRSARNCLLTRSSGHGALVALMEVLRHAANLGGDGFDGRPQRWVLASAPLHYVHSALPDFGGNLFDLVMAQSSQRVEPPQKPGRFKAGRNQSAVFQT